MAAQGWTSLCCPLVANSGLQAHRGVVRNGPVAPMGTVARWRVSCSLREHPGDFCPPSAQLDPALSWRLFLSRALPARN